MMPLLIYWISYLIPICLVSYLIGAIPFGYLTGKIIKGIDIRQFGSRNIGATNVYRTIGPIYGIVVLILDIAKGVIPVIVVQSLFGLEIWSILAGMATISGHNWPIFLKFHGGKGVATSIGVFMGLVPIPTIIFIIIFIVVVAITRYISLGTIISAICLPFIMYLFSESKNYVIFGIIISSVIIMKHISNIKRLLKGTEFKFKK